MERKKQGKIIGTIAFARAVASEPQEKTGRESWVKPRLPGSGARGGTDPLAGEGGGDGWGLMGAGAGGRVLIRHAAGGRQTVGRQWSDWHWDSGTLSGMTRSLLTCLRCGHQWTPQIAHRPRCCASRGCHSTSWDRPRSLPAAQAGRYPTHEQVAAMIAEAIGAALPEFERRIVATLRSGEVAAPGKRQTVRDGSTLDYDAY